MSSALMKAVEAGDVETVREYINNGGDIEAVSIYQSKMIHVAAKCGAYNILKLLIENGACIHSLDYGGMRRTALHWACQQGRLKCVEALVDAGADVTAEGKSWAKLVQGQRCGTLVDTQQCYPQTPSSLSNVNIVKLAVHRPPWCIEQHQLYPAKLKAAVLELLRIAYKGQRSTGGTEHSTDQDEGRLPITHYLLDYNCMMHIIPRIAYPLSTWLDDHDLAAIEAAQQQSYAQ